MSDVKLLAYQREPIRDIATFAPVHADDDPSALFCDLRNPNPIFYSLGKLFAKVAKDSAG